MKAVICCAVVILTAGAAWGFVPYSINGHVTNINWTNMAEGAGSGTIQAVAGAIETAKGVPFRQSLSLVLNSAALAKIARIGLQVGAYYPLIAGAVDAYMAYKNLIYMPDVPEVRQIDAGENEFAPEGCSGDCQSQATSVCNGNLSIGYVLGNSTAGDCRSIGYVGVGNYAAALGLNATCWMVYKCYEGGIYFRTYYVAPRVEGLVNVGEGEPGAVVAWGEVEAGLEVAMGQSRPEGFALVKAVGETQSDPLASSNEGWPLAGPESWANTSNYTDALGSEAQATYNEALTQAQKDLLAAATKTDDPSDPYAGWEDWEYSPTEIATAIETKLKPYLEPGEVTIEAEGDPPDKDSLPDVLDEFHDGVSSWEGLTLLNSLTLETNSANCNFCIDKPEILGLSGQVCYDCCPHESMLAGLGNILFGIMALCWLFWIFM